MATAHILHVGDESFHRAQILRSVGYDVDECQTLPKLAAWFRQRRQTDLVCISEEPDCAAEGVIALTRTQSLAPIVLFRAARQNYLQQDWDLEIQPITPTREWLNDVAHLIARARLNVARSKVLQERSRLLCEQTAQVCRVTGELRAQIQKTLLK